MSPDPAQSLSPSPELPYTRLIALIPVIPVVHTALDALRLQSPIPQNRGRIDPGSAPATKKWPPSISLPPALAPWMQLPQLLALWHAVDIRLVAASYGLTPWRDKSKNAPES